MEPKLIYLAKRNPSLMREDFTARWRQHGALGMSMPRWVNIRRYVHCDVQQPGIDGVSECYDGVGLIWHRSPEARARHRADNTSQGQMVDDEAHTFAEPVYNFCLLAEETILRSQGVGPVKLIRFVERSKAITGEAFARAWKGQYAPALLQDIASGEVLRYVQNHVLPPERPGGWALKSDCVDEFWFESGDKAAAAFGALSAPGKIDGELVSQSIWVATNEVILHDRPQP